MAKRESPRAAVPSLVDVPLGMIDEPAIASREVIDEQKLFDLAESIKLVGVIQPIILERQNGRYRIHAGHRRWLASTMAGMETVRAIVYAEGTVTGEALKLHENLYREDLNSGEEAAYLATLLETMCGGDVDRLCELVRQKRAYVEDRLLLLTGDKTVLLALKAGKINLSVAKEFNRYKDAGMRHAHLESAIQGGASARLVAEWRAKVESLPEPDGLPLVSPENQTSSRPAENFRMRCVVCESTEEVHQMELTYIHRGLCTTLLQRWLEAIHGQGTIGGANGSEAVAGR